MEGGGIAVKRVVKISVSSGIELGGRIAEHPAVVISAIDALNIFGSLREVMIVKPSELALCCATGEHQRGAADKEHLKCAVHR